MSRSLVQNQEKVNRESGMKRVYILSFFLVLAAVLLPTSVRGDVSSIITPSLFEEMLKHRNAAACPAKGFYNYGSFIAAANSFGGFGTTGDYDTQKRELAAFFAQTSHETTSGWPAAPDGPHAWGYCFKEEANNGPFCVPNQQWPCVEGRSYHGRGPMQITYNYNYGPAGVAAGWNLLEFPSKVANDPTIAFKTAIWFWMTPQSPKPSSHDVMTHRWGPSGTDYSAGRLPGFGVVTNIVNGGKECGKGYNDKAADRVGFYKRYCDMLGVSYGDNLSCRSQQPFGG